MNINQDTYSSYEGFIKIWSVSKTTGSATLLVDKPNTILYKGADLLAKALGGVTNCNISHMYLGYKNTADGDFTGTSISKAYTNPFSGYTGAESPPKGYLRMPLAFPASFLSSTNHESNIPVFTTMVTSASPTAQGGAEFKPSGDVTPSWIYEVALVAATTPGNVAGDVVFSRANFTPLQYDPAQNLTVSWGVKFTA